MINPLNTAHDWNHGINSALHALAAAGLLESEEHREQAKAEVMMLLGIVRISAGEHLTGEDRIELEILLEMVVMVPVGQRFDTQAVPEFPVIADALFAEWVDEPENNEAGGSTL